MDVIPSPALHYCVVDKRIIVLDPVQNRYFALPPRLAEAFESVINLSRSQSDDHAAIDELVRQNILVVGAVSSTVATREEIVPLGGDYPHVRHSAVSLRLTAQALMLRIWARWIVNRRTVAELSVISKRLANRRPERWKIRPDALDRILTAMFSVDRIVSVHEQCLPRSLALHVLCRRAGIETRMVLGVRENPFLAHCWVQREDLVVSGDFEQAALFTPILAIA